MFLLKDSLEIGGELTADYILGGSNSSAFDWDENHGLLITSLSATDVLEALSVETAIMDIYAIDLDGDKKSLILRAFHFLRLILSLLHLSAKIWSMPLKIPTLLQSLAPATWRRL